MNKLPASHPNSEIVEQLSLSLSQNPDQSSLSLKEKLEAWSPVQPLPTMYKVHDKLRNVSSEAYEPSLIAIGPHHSHKENLKKMEIHKLAYLRSFLDRKNTNIEHFASIIEILEPKARECYAEPITLNPEKFIDMLILDGCFIIEFALRCPNSSLLKEHDHIFSRNWVTLSVLRDLLLFENQIPLFIITKLFHDENPLFNLLNFCAAYFSLPVKIPDDIGNLDNIKHLLELFHRSLVVPCEFKIYEGMPVREDTVSFDSIRSATSLVEYNVTFEKGTESGSIFQIAFKNGSIWIPRLRVHEDSESHFRNLIAYEEYFEGKINPVGDYFKFMGCLINTPEDAKLLIDSGIIDSWLGNEKDVSDMFNKLTQNMTTDEGSFVYKWQFKEVNEHCSRRYNRWMAKLTQNHFNSPWAFLSIIAAIALLILTLLQTIFTVKI